MGNIIKFRADTVGWLVFTRQDKHRVFITYGSVSELLLDCGPVNYFFIKESPVPTNLLVNSFPNF